MNFKYENISFLMKKDFFQILCPSKRKLQFPFTWTIPAHVLEFLNNLWGLGTDKEKELSYQPTELVHFLTFKEPKIRFQGTSLCSLAGKYDNPIPTRFLSSIDCLKIQAQAT